ncbi:hypothetical protein [Actinoplanes couchii]|uniref:Uncharacterized protein n=1 Tax=Actinoplanes couchii TaxID=403638 RepID=A0ABQ3XCY5_9ACTN|nr:hypothetical protein [Actinoplanes couchii]MDR6323733.1 hypothetical protein [Actinoplanes couchii]GID56250.1 hypothetical protein Aco03nite_046540 [Actinoplanes couchii]
MTSISERLTDLAHRLAQLLDPADEKQLAGLLTAAGWTAEPNGRHRLFRSGDLVAYTRPAEVVVHIKDYGVPNPTAADLIYQESEAFAASIAGELGLPSAGALDVDPLDGWHHDPYLFRAGHWTVAIADVQQDTDLPLVVSAHFAWGADLTGRLTALAPPPANRAAPRQPDPALPADYQWLLDVYGTKPIGGILTLLTPDRFTTPPASRRLPVTPAHLLTMATTADGGSLAWVTESTRPWAEGPQPDSWVVVLAGGGSEQKYPYGLLRFLVLELL